MSDAYKRAAARLEEDKKKQAALEEGAKKAVEKVKSQKVNKPKKMSDTSGGNPAKQKVDWVSSLKSKVREYFGKKKKEPVKTARTQALNKQMRTGNQLSEEEVKKFNRGK